MKKQVFLLFIAIVGLLFTSCVSEDKVKMIGVKEFFMTSEYTFDVTVQIENQNGSNLSIKNGYVSLMEGKTELVKLSLADKVVIPRHSNEGLLFPIVWQLNDPDALSTLSEKAKDNNTMLVIGKITGQVGIFSKSYKIGPMPVDEFLGMLDESNRTLIKGFIGY